MGSSNVVELARFRDATRAVERAASLRPADVAPLLARAESLLYVGITPEGRMDYGLSGVEYEDAVNMIEIAGYLIGELSKIVAAGS